MSDWFAKNLGDAMFAEESLSQVELLFGELDREAEDSEEVAVFVRHESEGRLHCEVWLYFSPAASAIAKQMGAHRCRRPAPGGLGLLVGSEACRQRWFAGD